MIAMSVHKVWTSYPVAKQPACSKHCKFTGIYLSSIIYPEIKMFWDEYLNVIFSIVGESKS